MPDDVLKQVVSGLNESSAAGCSLLGYKEIKDLYHHGYAGTLKLVMEALLNGEATGEARAPNQHSPGTGGGPRERREAICGRCGSFFNSIWGRASTRTPISCGARRWLPTPRARALTQEAALSAVTAFTYDFWQYGSRAARKLIDFLEGDTVVETVRRMARRWKGCMVKFYIDNMVFEKSGRALADSPR